MYRVWMRFVLFDFSPGKAGKKPVQTWLGAILAELFGLDAVRLLHLVPLASWCFPAFVRLCTGNLPARCWGSALWTGDCSGFSWVSSLHLGSFCFWVTRIKFQPSNATNPDPIPVLILFHSPQGLSTFLVPFRSKTNPIPHDTPMHRHSCSSRGVC